MGNDRNFLERPSRRAFNKSIAAALFTTPLALAQVRGQECGVQEQRNANKTPGRMLQSRPDITVPCAPQGTLGTEPHQPPIIFGGGSLTVECEKEMRRVGPGPSKDRPHLYKFDDYRYGEMTYLQVISEHYDFFTTVCYNLSDAEPPIREARLKIWLQKFKGGAWVPGDITQDEPHILIRYRTSKDVDDENEAVVETDKKFSSPKRGFRREETFKHRHKGYDDTHYRIGKWALVAPDESVIACNSVTASQPIPKPCKPNETMNVEILGFQLIPRFIHLEDELRRRRAGRR